MNGQSAIVADRGRPGLRPDGRRRPGERDLRRMKRFATGLLLVATVIFLLARWWEVNGGPGWIGYVRATAEAGMVGALADWFAVTALFRRPLGLPIPHTAIIPTKKDVLGDSLGRLRRRELPVRGRRAGQAAPGSRSPRGSAAGSASRPTPTGSPPSWPPPRAASVTVLRDDDVQAVVEQVARPQAHGAAGRPAAGHGAGRACSPTGRTTGWSTSSATAPTTGCAATSEMVLRHRPRAGARLDAAVRRRAWSPTGCTPRC